MQPMGRPGPELRSGRGFPFRTLRNIPKSFDGRKVINYAAALAEFEPILCEVVATIGGTEHRG